MQFDIIWSILFMGLAVYFIYDGLWGFNRKEINAMVPGWRYFRVPLGVLMFLGSLFWLLDTLGLIDRWWLRR